jgi:hypothetical protein
LAGERAELGRVLTRLAVLTGTQLDPIVAGELLPPMLPAIETALNRLEQRPDLLALSRRGRGRRPGWPRREAGCGDPRSDGRHRPQVG